MPLYTCPGCKKPISESQPLDHCLGCEAMYAAHQPTSLKPSTNTCCRNQRQRLRSQGRSNSISEGHTGTEYTIITIILRRPSQQYPSGSTPPPPYEAAAEEMGFPWEAEIRSSFRDGNGVFTRQPASSVGGSTAHPINIGRT